MMVMDQRLLISLYQNMKYECMNEWIEFHIGKSLTLSLGARKWATVCAGRHMLYFSFLSFFRRFSLFFFTNSIQHH